MVPQFYLSTPEIDDVPAFLGRLEPLIATGALAVLRLRFPAGDEAGLKRKAAVLRVPLQEAGIACLIDCPEDVRAIARLGLDGAHVAAPGPQLAEAIEALKPDRIVGIGGLSSRHDAMEAGESDIDYIMFGEPRPDGWLPPFERTLERAAWWTEIFNVPCVAHAPDADSVAALAAIGVEFIGLGPWVFEADDPARLLADLRRAAKDAEFARPATG